MIFKHRHHEPETGTYGTVPVPTKEKKCYNEVDIFK